MREFARPTNLRGSGGLFVATRQECRVPVGGARQDRDLARFLAEVKKAGLLAVVRIGPWAHGEAREGGFPDWLIDEAERQAKAYDPMNPSDPKIPASGKTDWHKPEGN